MKKKLLLYSCLDTNGGQYRRIARLSRDSDSALGTETVQVNVISFRHFSMAKSLKKEKLGKYQFILPILLPFRVFPLVWRLNAIIVAFVVWILSLIYRPYVYWGEQELAGMIIRRFKGKLIYDIHGDAVEEARYRGSSEKWLKFLEKECKKSLGMVDKVIVQSSEQKRRYQKLFNIPSDKFIVYNCGTDTELFDYNKVDIPTFRKKMKYNDTDIIFTYVGNDAKWQLLKETLKIYRDLKRILPKAKCQILLQGDKEPLLHFCSDNEINDVKILEKVPFLEVYKYVSISNFAWLLRDDVLMNQVASPTKLGEYLACGQIVITTSVINSWDWLSPSDAIIVDYKKPKKAAQIIVDYVNTIDNWTIMKDKMRKIGVENLSSKEDRERLLTLR